MMRRSRRTLMKRHSYQLCSVLAVILLASCGGKDPLLVKKAAEQQTEITRLRAELVVLDEQFRNLPQDRSTELATAHRAAETQDAEIVMLEAQLAKLQARKAQLAKEYDEYKRKYVIR